MVSFAVLSAEFDQGARAAQTDREDIERRQNRLLRREDADIHAGLRVGCRYL
jgi:hypothetical protein